MTAIDTLIRALEISPEVRRGTAHQLVAQVRAEMRSATLTEAADAVIRATAQNRVEYPDVEAMETRRMGMRAAERIVRSLDAPAPAPDLTPIPLRWDRLVMHPAGEDDHTIVACMTDDGRPAALFLDDEHREALGLQLVDPDGDGETAPRVPDALAARLRTLHYEVDGSPDRGGSCIEDGQNWPCATIRALTVEEDGGTGGTVRLDLLRRSIGLSGPGFPWTTRNVMRTFNTVGVPMTRASARSLLAQLAAEGVLKQIDQPGRRHFVATGAGDR